MDFYYALTLYHILCCVVHKLNFNRNSAVLALSDKTVNVYAIKSRLESMKIFKKVFIINDSEIQNKLCMDFSNEYEDFEESLTEAYCEISPIKMEHYNDKYICADHFPSGLYCCIKTIGYYYFEDGNGQHSRVEETVAGIKKNNPLQYELINKYGLFGNNDCVIKRIIDMSSQLDGYVDERVIDFRIIEILKSMEPRDKAMVYQIFDAGYLKNISNKSSVILISQSQANLGLMSEMGQYKEYALVLDYFAENKQVLVKPHPNDVYVNYRKMGEDVQILSGNFPIELLAGGTDIKFEKGISVWSTAINSIRSIVGQEVRFSIKLDDDYEKMHRYFAASKMIELIKSSYGKVYVFHANLELARNMFMENGMQFEQFVELQNVEEIDAIENDAVLIIDELDDVAFEQRELLRKKVFQLNKSIITIMINSNEENVLFGGVHHCELNNMAFWEILVRDRNGQEEDKIERIWVYMKDTTVLERIKGFKASRGLERTGLDIYINCYDMETDKFEKYDIYSVKELKGILEATEKRLLDELKNNDELMEIVIQQEKQIDELKETQKDGQDEQFENLEKRLEESMEMINNLKEELIRMKKMPNECSLCDDIL